MRRRWDQAPAAARARGDDGNRRLHRRWQAFDARHKKPAVANTAIARELASWCWSLATMDGYSHPRPVSWHHQTGPRASVEQTRARAMSNQHPQPVTLVYRQADTLQPNAPSCGNQPANISLTRVATTRPRVLPPNQATKAPPITQTGGA